MNGSGKSHFIKNKITDYTTDNKKLKTQKKIILSNLDTTDNLGKSFTDIQKEIANNINKKTTIISKKRDATEVLENYIKKETDGGDNTFNLMPYQWEKFSKFNISISSKSTFIVQNDLSLFIKINNQIIDLKNAPSGVKNIIYLIVNACNIEPNDETNNHKNNIVILLDEFDNYLHPYWIKTMSEFIIETAINNYNIEEVFITTHNPYTLECFKYCDIGYIKYDNDKPYYFSYFEFEDEEEESSSQESFESKLKTFSDYCFEQSKPSGEPKQDFPGLNTTLIKLRDRIDTEYANLFFQNTQWENKKLIICEGIIDKLWIQKAYSEKNISQEVIQMYGKYNFYWALLILKIVNFPLNKVIYVRDTDKDFDEKGVISSKKIDTMENQIKSFYSNLENSECREGLKLVLFGKNLEDKLCEEFNKKQIGTTSFEKFNFFYENSTNEKMLNYIWDKIYNSKTKNTK